MESDLTGTCYWPGKDEVGTEAVAGRRERRGDRIHSLAA